MKKFVIEFSKFDLIGLIRKIGVFIKNYDYLKLRNKLIYELKQIKKSPKIYLFNKFEYLKNKISILVKKVISLWNRLPLSIKTFSATIGIIFLCLLLISIFGNVYRVIEFNVRPKIVSINIYDGQKDVLLNSEIKIKLNRPVLINNLQAKIEQDNNINIEIVSLGKNEYLIKYQESLKPDNEYTLKFENNKYFQNNESVTFYTVETPKIVASNLNNVHPENEPILIGFNQGIFADQYNQKSEIDFTKIITFAPEIQFTTEILSPSIIRILPKDSIITNGTYTLKIEKESVKNNYDLEMSSTYVKEFKSVAPDSQELQSLKSSELLVKSILDVEENSTRSIYLFFNENIDVNSIQEAINLKTISSNQVSSLSKDFSIEVSKMSVNEYEAQYSDEFYNYKNENIVIVKITPSQKWNPENSYAVNINQSIKLNNGLHSDRDQEINVNVYKGIYISTLYVNTDSLYVSFTDHFLNDKENLEKLIKVTDSKGQNVEILDLRVNNNNFSLNAKFLKGENYKLYIEKGIVDRFGRTSDYFMERDFSMNEEDAYVYIEGPKLAMVDNTGSHKLLIESNGVKSIKLEYVKVKDIKVYQELNKKYGNEKLDYIFSIQNAQNLNVKELESTDRAQFVEEIKNFEDGLYIFRVSSGEYRDYKIISLTKYAIYQKNSESSTLAWIVSLKDGKAYSEKQINGIDFDLSESKVTYSTNQEGIVNFDSPVDIIYNEDFSIFSTKDLSSNLNPYESGEKDIEYLAYTFSDRYVYKPGDTINFKAFLRQKDWPLNIVSDNSFRVTLKNYENSLYSVELKTNEFGTINNSFQIPLNAKVGSYTFSVEDLSNKKIQTNQHEIRIEEYKIHNFEVFTEVSAKDIYSSSDTVNLKVNANYFFGQPLEEAQVEVSLYIRDSSNFYMLARDKSAAFEGESYQLRNYSYNDYDYKTYSSKKIAQVNAALDSNGYLELNIPFTVPEELAYTNGKTLSTEIKITDSLGDTEYYTFYGVVSPKGGVFGVKQDSQNSVKIRYFDERLNPKAKSHLIANIYQTEYSYRLVKNVSGILYKEGYDKKTLIDSISVYTDDEGSARINLGSYGEGIYDVEVMDGNNDKISTQFLYSKYWFIADQSYDLYNSDNQVEIKLDKEEYQIGDIVSFVPAFEVNTYRVLASIEKEGLVDYRIFEKDQTGNMSFKIEDHMLPNFHITIFAIKTLEDGSEYIDYKFGTVNVKVSTKNKNLEIKATTDKTNYVPGETVKIEVKSVEEKEVEYMIAVVDKAVLQLEKISSREGVQKKIVEALWSSWMRDVHNSSNTTIYENRIIDEKKWGSKGGAGGNGGFLDSLQAEDIRNTFKDSLLWIPAVKSDNGKFETEFKLSDNLTTWNVFVIGYTKDGEVGVNSFEVIASKDLNLIDNLPNEIYVSDELEILYNASLSSKLKSEGGNFEVEIKSENGEILCNDKYEKSCLSVISIDSWPIKYRYVPKEVGKDKLTIGVKKNDTILDVLEKEITINSDKQLVTDNFYGTTLSNNSFEYEFLDSSENRVVTIQINNSLVTNLDEITEYFIDYENQCSEQTSSQILALLPTTQNNAKSKKLVEDGIIRLMSIQNYDGGWGVWQGNSSLLYNSIYATYALNEAKNSGFDVSELALKNARAYLDQKVNYLNNYDQKIYIPFLYYVLAQNGDYKVSESINFYNRYKSNLSLQNKAYLLSVLSSFYNSNQIGLLQRGSVKKSMDEISKDIWTHSKRNGSMLYWKDTIQNSTYDNDIKTNTAIIESLLETWGNDERLIAGISYLQNATIQKSLGTHENYAIYSILNKAQKIFGEGTLKNFNGKIIVNGQKLTSYEEIEDGVLYTYNVPNDVKKVEVKVESLGLNYFNARITSSIQMQKVEGVDNGISLATEIVDLQGKKVTNLKYGQLYQIKSYFILPDDSQQTDVKISLPAGLEAINFNLNLQSSTLFENENQQNSNNLGLSFVNHRLVSDGLHLYTGDSLYNSSLKKGLYEYSVYARAVRRGKFSVYGSTMQEMYLPGRSSQQKSQFIIVE